MTTDAEMVENGSELSVEPDYDRKREEGASLIWSFQKMCRKKIIEGETEEVTEEYTEIPFPDNIFVLKKSGETLYYFAPDELEENRFDKLIIRCENGKITDISIGVISVSSTPPSIRLFSDPLVIVREEDIISRDIVVDDVENGTVCDITECIIDLLETNDNNYAASLKVPSMKRCTVRVSARPYFPGQLRDEETIWVFCDNQLYSIWKKLVSRVYEVDRIGDVDYDSFGTRLTERRIAQYYRDRVFDLSADVTSAEIDEIINGAHLFYYRFQFPINAISIDIFDDQDYSRQKDRVWDNRERQIVFPSASDRRYNAHQRFKEQFDEALDLAGRVWVDISYTVSDEKLNRKEILVRPHTIFRLDELIMGGASNSNDGAWVERFQADRRNISAHCYGLAVDINTGNSFNRHEYNVWEREITRVLRNLTYDRCEKNENEDTRTYFFSYKYQEGEQPHEMRKNDKYLDLKEKFKIVNGEALVNWFLFHLAFKENGFFWGAYFNKTDAMHFSLVESPGLQSEIGRANQDKAFTAYPVLDQHKIEYFDGNNKLYTVFHKKNYRSADFDDKLDSIVVPVLEKPPINKDAYVFKHWIDENGRVFQGGSEALAQNNEILKLYAKWEHLASERLSKLTFR